MLVNYNSRVYNQLASCLLRRQFGTKPRSQNPGKKLYSVPTSWSTTDSESEKVSAIIADLRRLEFYDATSLIQCVKTAGEVKLKNAEFWTKVSSAIIDISSSLTSTESIDLLWVFAGMNQLRIELLESLLVIINVNLGSIKTTTLMKLLWVLQEIEHNDRSIYAAIANVFCSRIDDFDPPLLAKTIRYFGEIRYSHSLLLEKLAAKFCHMSSKFETEPFLYFVQGMVGTQLNDSSLNHVVAEESQRRFNSMAIGQALTLIKRLSFLDIDSPLLIVSVVSYCNRNSIDIPFQKLGTLTTAIARMWTRQEYYDRIALQNFKQKIQNKETAKKNNKKNLAVQNVDIKANTSSSKKLGPLWNVCPIESCKIDKPNTESDELILPSCYVNLKKNDENGVLWVRSTSRCRKTKIKEIIDAEPEWKVKCKQLLEWITRSVLSSDAKPNKLVLLKIYTALQSIDLESSILNQSILDALYYELSLMKASERVEFLELKGQRFPVLYDFVLTSFYFENAQLLKDSLALNDDVFLRVFRAFSDASHSRGALCCIDALQFPDQGRIHPQHSELSIGIVPSAFQFAFAKRDWDIKYGIRRRANPEMLLMSRSIVKKMFSSEDDFLQSLLLFESPAKSIQKKERQPGAETSYPNSQKSVTANPVGNGQTKMNIVEHEEKIIAPMLQKYRRLLGYINEVDTDILATACLTYRSSGDSFEWYMRLYERLKKDPSVFPVGSIPPLLFELCYTIGRPLKHSWKGKKEIDEPGEPLTLTSETAKWISLFCHRVFPTLTPIPSNRRSHSRMQRAAKNIGWRHSSYSLPPSSYATLLRALTLLKPHLKHNLECQHNSPVSYTELQNPSYSKVMTVDAKERESFWKEYEFALRFVGDAASYAVYEHEIGARERDEAKDSLTSEQRNDYECPNPDSIIFEQTELYNLSHRSSFRIQSDNDYQNDETKKYTKTKRTLRTRQPLTVLRSGCPIRRNRCLSALPQNSSTLIMEKLNTTILRTILLSTELLLSNTDPNRLSSYPNLVPELSSRISKYSFKDALKKSPTFTTCRQIGRAIETHLLYEIPNDFHLYTAFCLLSNELSTPEELLSALHLIEKSQYRDIRGLDFLGAAVDQKEHQITSARVHQKIVEVCKKLNIKHLTDVAEALTREDSGGFAVLDDSTETNNNQETKNKRNVIA